MEILDILLWIDFIWIAGAVAIGVYLGHNDEVREAYRKSSGKELFQYVIMLFMWPVWVPVLVFRTVFLIVTGDRK